MAGQLPRVALVAAAVIALDRATKLWVVECLDLATRGFIPVLDPWLNLAMAWNEGINFGLFDFGAAGRWVLIALALAICAALIVWVRRTGGWRYLDIQKEIGGLRTETELNGPIIGVGLHF